MLIISKYKDYYDYLTGIWGVDNKLVLDRTDSFHIGPYNKLNEKSKCTIYICDFQVDGAIIDGKFVTGKELEPYASKDRWYSKGKYEKEYYIDLEGSRDDWRGKWYLKAPTKLIDSPNVKENCPILLERYSSKEYYKFPVLKDFDFHKVYPAEEIFLMLSEWLGKQLNKQVPDNQTDKEKIISHGFDTKTSFRKM